MYAWQDLFNEENYALYHSLAIDNIVRPWEKLVMGMRFTELGALRFDKDFRAVSTYIAGQTNLGVREKFIRLQQMSYILNLSDVSREPRPSTIIDPKLTKRLLASLGSTGRR